MRKQKVLYLLAIIVIIGGCCADLLYKCLPGIEGPSSTINVPGNTPKFYVVSTGLLLVFTICTEVMILWSVIDEIIKGIDRLRPELFQLAIVNYSSHVLAIGLIGFKNPDLQPFLIMEILGTEISWPYHLGLNVLMLFIAYLGWDARADLAWEKYCNELFETKSYNPFYERSQHSQ